MGEILGLGITHYPGLAYKGNLSRRINMLLADPLLPERLRSPANWPATMREQWADDEGEAHSTAHRQDMIDEMRRARQELDAFEPDFVVIWGDDQYENFKEDCVPAFARPGLRLGRHPPLGARQRPRRQLLGRAEGHDLHDQGPPRRRQVHRRLAAAPGLRHRLLLQAAPRPGPGPCPRQLGAVPRLGPPGLPASGRADQRERLRPPPDSGPGSAADALRDGARSRTSSTRPAPSPGAASSWGPPWRGRRRRAPGASR